MCILGYKYTLILFQLAFLRAFFFYGGGGGGDLLQISVIEGPIGVKIGTDIEKHKEHRQVNSFLCIMVQIIYEMPTR